MLLTHARFIQGRTSAGAWLVEDGAWPRTGKVKTIVSGQKSTAHPLFPSLPEVLKALYQDSPVNLSVHNLLLRPAPKTKIARDTASK